VPPQDSHSSPLAGRTGTRLSSSGYRFAPCASAKRRKKGSFSSRIQARAASSSCSQSMSEASGHIPRRAVQPKYRGKNSNRRTASNDHAKRWARLDRYSSMRARMRPASSSVANTDSVAALEWHSPRSTFRRRAEFAVARHTPIRSCSHSSTKTENWFQLRVVGVTKIDPSTGSSFRVVPVGAPDLR